MHTRQSVTVEITTRCNLKCVMCPHGLPGGYPGQRDIDTVLIDNIIDSFDRLDFVLPTGVGEPLISSSFWRLVDALRGRTRPGLMFVTNGILLTPANVERIVAAPVRRVTVSVDAVRPETHSRIRGNDLEKTLQGIRNLKSAFVNCGRPNGLVMSFVIMRENYSEIPSFVDLAADMGAYTVYFEHLTPLMSKAISWIVGRNGWEFNYADQDMRSDIDRADEMMSLAVMRADELGLALGGYHVFLNPEMEASHLTRPSRHRFLSAFRSEASSGVVM